MFSVVTKHNMNNNDYYSQSYILIAKNAGQKLFHIISCIDNNKNILKPKERPILIT